MGENRERVATAQGCQGCRPAYQGQVLEGSQGPMGPLAIRQVLVPIQRCQHSNYHRGLRSTNQVHFFFLLESEAC